ncbi:MAG: metalloregulator ArsR/SmtB family transcription factor [Marivibrio sp.]|uniref:ArsR/SmtB family transcription factor n=1 Tax=Marivibrio sp. TaxID=2039719 RepID=UPI0032EB2A62
MSEELERTAACLEALGNPTRLAIYRLLVRAGDAGKPVGHIQKALEVPASTLSHHLKHLELVGLVARRREGTTHNCVACYMTMDHVLGFLTRECCADAPGAAPRRAAPAHKTPA